MNQNFILSLDIAPSRLWDDLLRSCFSSIRKASTTRTLYGSHFSKSSCCKDDDDECDECDEREEDDEEEEDDDEDEGRVEEEEDEDEERRNVDPRPRKRPKLSLVPYGISILSQKE